MLVWKELLASLSMTELNNIYLAIGLEKEKRAIELEKLKKASGLPVPTKEELIAWKEGNRIQEAIFKYRDRTNVTSLLDIKRVFEQAFIPTTEEKHLWETALDDNRVKAIESYRDRTGFNDIVAVGKLFDIRM